jgi:hypothetical protein
MAVAVVAARAEAEPETSTEPPTFASSGQFVLSLDRLAEVGVDVVRSNGREAEGAPPLSDACSSTTVRASFFGYGGGSGALCPFGRFGGYFWGADFFVAEGVSLGGAMSFTSTSQNRDAHFSGSGTTSDKGTSSNRSITLSPRVGYARALGSKWTIWPRVGIDWTDAKFEQDQYTEADGQGSTGHIGYAWHFVSASADVKFVFSPTPHVAFFGGPFVNVPIWMDTDVDWNGMRAEHRTKAYALGATAGVLLYL